MDKWQMNPLDRALAELNDQLGEAKKMLDLLDKNRDLVRQVSESCGVSTVCTTGGEVTLWIKRDDLPKARTILGRLKVTGRHASGENQLCVFLKTDQPEIQLAYYRPAPDPAHSRCKIVTQEETKTTKHYALVCPS